MLRSARMGGGVAVAVVSLLLAGTAAASTSTPHGIGPLIPAKGSGLPTHGGTADSLNWSGYAVTPTSDGITAVSSTFVVPSAGLVPPGFAATWTGIGGYNTSDLIQAGASEDSLPSNDVFGPQYNAWYEILPASETPISGCTGDANCTVTPGDVISVTISNAGGDNW